MDSVWKELQVISISDLLEEISWTLAQVPKEALEVQMSTEDICATLKFTKEFEWKCLIVKTCLNFGKSIQLPCHEKQF